MPARDGRWRTRIPSASPRAARSKSPSSPSTPSPAIRLSPPPLPTPAPASLDSVTDLDKGHGRIEERTVTLAREIDRLGGDRRFPGELRPPGVATIIKVAARTELKDRGRFDTRYYVSSAILAGWADHDLAAILKAEAR